MLLIVAWLQCQAAQAVIRYAIDPSSLPAITSLVVAIAPFLYGLAVLVLLVRLIANHLNNWFGRHIYPVTVGGAFLVHLFYAHALLLPPLMLELGAVPRRPSQALLERMLLASGVEVYSLIPGSVASDGSGFHGYTIIGQTKLEDSDDVQELTGALVDGFKYNPAIATMCFEPRHGLRLSTLDSSLDLVICYSCKRVRLVDSGRESELVMSKKTKELLDRHLGEAGIEISK